MAGARLRSHSRRHPAYTNAKLGSLPQLQPCDPGSPSGGRGGRSRTRGPEHKREACSRECCCWGESRATSFLWLGLAESRREWEGSRARAQPSVFHLTRTPTPHRLESHKSLCMKPCSPENGLFPPRTSSASPARSREPFAFASPAFSGPPAPFSPALLSEPQPAPPASAVWVFIDLSSNPLTGFRTPAP